MKWQHCDDDKSPCIYSDLTSSKLRDDRYGFKRCVRHGELLSKIHGDYETREEARASLKEKNR